MVNITWDDVYLALEDFAYQIQERVRGNNKMTFFSFSDKNICPPTTNDLDASLRKLVVVIDNLKEAERLEAYEDGKQEGTERGYDVGYDSGYWAGRDDRGYDNDEAYDRSIGN